jgi:hypothetical protein
MDKDCNPACRGGANAASERSARGLIGEQAILFAHRWRGAMRRRGRDGDDIQITARAISWLARNSCQDLVAWVRQV